MPEINWNELKHAYGDAEDIPALLKQLELFPAEASYDQEPWFSLWSSLCHQDDIYSASLVAIPEIVATLEKAPEKATLSFFLLPASIEVIRHKKGIIVPIDLDTRYHNAISKLSTLALQVATQHSNSELARAALALIAVAVGQYEHAELILEISQTEAGEVLEWYQSR